MTVQVIGSKPSAGVQPGPTGAATLAAQKEQKVEAFLREFREGQQFGKAIVAGLLAAVAGAVAWGGITAATSYQIGWMAVAVGALVGYAVRIAGKGIDPKFGCAGAVLALAGCLAGNILAVCFFVSAKAEVPFISVVSQLTPETCYGLLKATFSPMDLIFYGLAVTVGFRSSFRHVTREEVAKLVEMVPAHANARSRARDRAVSTRSGRSSRGPGRPSK
jgi:hypothetical protein